MSANGVLQEIKLALSGRPGQPIVLGVCRALARRWHCEVWFIRLVVLVFGLVWTLPVLAAYAIAGFALPETEQRTRTFFSGLAVLAREQAGKALSALGRLFDGAAGRDHRRSRGY
jgi:phage shock protein PspC (stress-responsive transcriptional regulator)